MSKARSTRFNVVLSGAHLHVTGANKRDAREQAGFDHLEIISEKKLTLLKEEENRLVQIPHELYSIQIKAVESQLAHISPIIPAEEQSGFRLSLINGEMVS